MLGLRLTLVLEPNIQESLAGRFCLWPGLTLWFGVISVPDGRDSRAIKRKHTW